MKYTSITIIYNPHSTGPSERLAKDFRAALRTALPNASLLLKKTKYAGHAEEIAYTAAKDSEYALVISSSGDGGYHDVVNGLMRAQKEGASPVAGLLPAGNANDHFRQLQAADTPDLVQGVMQQREHSIDLLMLTTTKDGQPFSRYAHSYIGLGLTPEAGNDLNEAHLNRLNEIWIVLRALFKLKSTKLIIRGRRRSYDSLVCSNVRTMSKVISLSKVAQLDDGKFEVTSVKARSKLSLLRSLFMVATVGFNVQKQYRRFAFQTTRRTLVQLDGEVHRIDGKVKATVGIEGKVFRCVV